MNPDAAARADRDELAARAQGVEPGPAGADAARAEPCDRLLGREEPALDLGDGVEGLAPAHGKGRMR